MNLGGAIVEGEDTSSQFLKGARPSSPHNFGAGIECGKIGQCLGEAALAPAASPIG
jgi:hypothetical protein